jgi:hypothetical protein
MKNLDTYLAVGFRDKEKSLLKDMVVGHNLVVDFQDKGMIRLMDRVVDYDLLVDKDYFVGIL